MSPRDGPTYLSRSFAPNLAAPAAARASLSGLLGNGFNDDLRQRSELVLTEVVTNSVRHAELNDSQPIEVDVALSHDLLRFEITDEGPGFQPVPVPSKPDHAPGGWGLWLVDRLTDRWGVDFSHSTRVWCEFDTHTGEAHADWGCVD